MARRWRFRQDIREWLASLTDERGRIDPLRMISSARDPKCPGHGLFTWDNEEAGDHWRLYEARRILRVYSHTTEVGETRQTQAPLYVRDPLAPPDVPSYVTTWQLRNEPVNARAVLLRECDRVVSALQRTRNVAAALNLSDEVDRILLDTMDFRSLVERLAEEVDEALTA